MTSLRGTGFTQQDLGRLAAARSLANRGITNVYVKGTRASQGGRRVAAGTCVACGVPADHPVHAAPVIDVERSGRRAVPHMGRSMGPRPEKSLP